MVIRINDGVARFGLPGLFLGLAVAWVGGFGGPPAVAQSRAGGDASTQVATPARATDSGRPQQSRLVTSGDSNGTLALVTSPAGSVQWLYLIDTKSRAFAIYRVDPSNPKGSLKLEAARQYQWDLKLEHYNNQTPEPSAIEAAVKSLTPTTR
jgi:hypothetical protein